MVTFDILNYIKQTESVNTQTNNAESISIDITSSSKKIDWRDLLHDFYDKIQKSNSSSLSISHGLYVSPQYAAMIWNLFVK